MSYNIAIQQTKAKQSCVCIVSRSNGKLILKGEPINRRIDAVSVGQALIAAFQEPSYVIEVLPWNHKWPANKGPKKAAKKK